MTRMMIRPEQSAIELPSQEAPLVQALPERSSYQDQIRAAAAYSFRDLVHIEIHHTPAIEPPNLHEGWTHASTLPGIVVKVQEPKPLAYAGLVPVLADEPYPSYSRYTDQGPRLLDPLAPVIEKIPEGKGWLKYVLRPME